MPSFRFCLRFGVTLLFALLLSVVAALSLAPSWKAWAILVAALWLGSSIMLWRHREWYYSAASRRVRLALLATLAVTLAWMAWDDAALRRPQTMAEAMPLPAGGAESAAIFRRFGEAGAPEFSERKFIPATYPATPAEWPAFLQKHAAAIRADWEQCRFHRETVTQLGAFAEIGDDTTSFADSSRFLRGVRSASYLHDNYARLLASEGRGDEAFAVIRPLLALGYKMQRTSRTVVRYMVGVVLQGMGQSTLGFILEHGHPSTATLREMTALLERGTSPKGTIGRVLLTEFAGVQPLLLLEENAELAPFRGHAALQPFVRFFYSPRATANEVARAFEALAADAEARNLESLRTAGKSDGNDGVGRPRLKNPIGVLMVQMSTPAIAKLTESAWKKDDDRRALLTSLESRIASSGRTE